MVITVIMQELPWEIAAACSSTGSANNITVTEESAALTEGTEP